MIRKEWIGEAGKCIAFACLLFFSAVFVLMISRDMEHLELFSDKLGLILGGYILGVAAVRLISGLPLVKKIGEWCGILFHGFAYVYWIGLLSLLCSIVGESLEAYIRYIFIANVLVLAGVYVGRYLHLRRVAQEMNRGRSVKNFVLLEDLERRPKNEDEFMEWVEDYCKKSGLDYEVIQYGIPSLIVMDGVRYRVQVTEYCSMASGIVPAMEFTVI